MQIAFLAGVKSPSSEAATAKSGNAPDQTASRDDDFETAFKSADSKEDSQSGDTATATEPDQEPEGAVNESIDEADPETHADKDGATSEPEFDLPSAEVIVDHDAFVFHGEETAIVEKLATYPDTVFEDETPNAKNTVTQVSEPVTFPFWETAVTQKTVAVAGTVEQIKPVNPPPTTPIAESSGATTATVASVSPLLSNGAPAVRTNVESPTRSPELGKVAKSIDGSAANLTTNEVLADDPTLEPGAWTRSEKPVSRSDLVSADKSVTANPTTRVAAESAPATALSGSTKVAEGAALDTASLASGPAGEPEIVWDLRSNATVTVDNKLQPRLELPQLVARQLAEALHRGPDGRVELSMNPAELGRVRMSISAAETGVTVLVATERVETLELMRRNIETLGREFAELGYEQISFSFADSGQSFENAEQEDGQRPTNDSNLLELVDEPLPVGPVSTPLGPLNWAAGGVDVRI
ncbi:MAG: flagellar hook-length control protein FliK [Pseudomonadota bacterium]